MIDIRLSDNLELMAEMQDNTVDLIYCDILYGTGKDFGDYEDLKPIKEDIENHYAPRIKEMHRILKDTGSIYLQMDCKINHWIRCIMDDVFGYNNFRNEIIWCYEKARPTKYSFKKVHDNILFYQKKLHKKFNIQYVPRVRKKDYKTDYDGKICPDWWNDIYSFGTIMNAPERNGYKTQKPKKLIERIIKASSNEGDLVADFYAGSFTTAEVCKDLNRNFIGCDISEKAVAIGLERTKY